MNVSTQEKNELNNIILNRTVSNINRKIIILLSTIGVMLIIILMILSNIKMLEKNVTIQKEQFVEIEITKDDPMFPSKNKLEIKIETETLYLKSKINIDEFVNYINENNSQDRINYLKSKLN